MRLEGSRFEFNADGTSALPANRECPGWVTMLTGLKSSRQTGYYLLANTRRAKIRPATFPMERSHSKRLEIISTARGLLASVLLAAFVAGIVPLASVSAGSTCTLECCAGKAPHASGSCMKGSCQAVLLTARAHNHHARLDRAEKFCGLPKTFKSASFARRRIDAAPQRSPDQITAAAVAKPCQPDCGGSFGLTNLNRQRNSAGIADANRPRPPTDLRLSLFSHHGVQILAAQSRRGAPRGPPFVLS